jgi:hypothetical protein
VPVLILLVQAGVVGGLISYGIFRDIRREIRTE